MLIEDVMFKFLNDGEFDIRIRILKIEVMVYDRKFVREFRKLLDEKENLYYGVFIFVF